MNVDSSMIAAMTIWAALTIRNTDGLTLVEVERVFEKRRWSKLFTHGENKNSSKNRDWSAAVYSPLRSSIWAVKTAGMHFDELEHVSSWLFIDYQDIFIHSSSGWLRLWNCRGKIMPRMEKEVCKKNFKFPSTPIFSAVGMGKLLELPEDCPTLPLACLVRRSCKFFTTTELYNRHGPVRE